MYIAANIKRVYYTTTSGTRTDPIVHLACTHAAIGRPMSVAMLSREHRRAVEAMSREADHLAVLHSAPAL